MMSPGLILIVIALAFVIGNAGWKLPLWPAVLCLILLHLIR
jgi:hypothetical protein